MDIIRIILVAAILTIPLLLPSVAVADEDDCWEDPWMRTFCEMERKKRIKAQMDTENTGNSNPQPAWVKLCYLINRKGCFDVDIDGDDSAYMGFWTDNKQHGWGININSDGDVYIGQWREGDREGAGTLILADGTIKKGIWEDDELQKEGRASVNIEKVPSNIGVLINEEKALQSRISSLRSDIFRLIKLYGTEQEKIPEEPEDPSLSSDRVKYSEGIAYTQEANKWSIIKTRIVSKKLKPLFGEIKTTAKELSSVSYNLTQITLKQDALKEEIIAEKKRQAEIARLEKEERERQREIARRKAEEEKERRRLAAAKAREEKERLERIARRKAEEEKERRRIAAAKAAEEKARRERGRLVQTAQRALRKLQLYKGPINGAYDDDTSEAFESWLENSDYSNSSELDIKIVKTLVSDAAAYVKLLADKKLYARLKPKAASLFSDAKAFIKRYPSSPIFLEATMAAAGLQKVLKKESGEELRKQLNAFKGAIGQNKEFIKFRSDLIKERARIIKMAAMLKEKKQAELKAQKIRKQKLAFANMKSELLAYKEFLATKLADSLGKDSSITETLIPIIQDVEAGLKAADPASAAKILGVAKKKIDENDAISEAFDAIAKSFSQKLQQQAKLNEKLIVLKNTTTQTAANIPKAPKRISRKGRKTASNKHGVAVIIGNKNYADRTPPVDYAHNDADAMKGYVINNLGYREGNIIDIRDATQAQMMALFGTKNSHQGKLFNYVRPRKSDVTVFYSGHGTPGLRDKRGYLLPVNADPNLVEINGYPVDILYGNLRKLDAKSVTVYLDACFSGDSPKGMIVRATSGISVKALMPKKVDNLSILTAAQGDQFASWDEDAKMGLFTKNLLLALGGAADGGEFGNGDGRVALGEVKRFLDDEMSYQARRRYNRLQKATVIGNPGTVLSKIAR